MTLSADLRREIARTASEVRRLRLGLRSWSIHVSPLTNHRHRRAHSGSDESPDVNPNVSAM